MSFFHKAIDYGTNPIKALQGEPLTARSALDPLGIFNKKTVPPVPTLNPNDAANAAQQTTDAMRMRRGLLANIYGGASNTQPVSGKQQLGT